MVGGYGVDSAGGECFAECLRVGRGLNGGIYFVERCAHVFVGERGVEVEWCCLGMLALSISGCVCVLLTICSRENYV